MVCLQAGEHVLETRYGFLGVLPICSLLFIDCVWTHAHVIVFPGVIAAIVWFPLGIGLCLLDRRVQCKRCGDSIEEGLCS
jgi:hypothetical protein